MKPKVVIYTHRVEWKIFDRVGNEIERSSKLFPTEPKAQVFAKELKRGISQDKNAVIFIRELKNDEIIQRFKKNSGNVNFKQK